MKIRLMAVGLLVLAGADANRDLLACGDKFLIVSRGTRFHRAASLRQPAAILVYANPASELPKALANLQVDATLHKAGYRPTLVSSADEFDKALRQGGWDLLLVDVADAQAVSGRLPRDGTTVVLPIAYNPTGTQWAQVKKQYQHVLKAPTKNHSFLETVDEALSLRPRTELKGADKTSR